MAQNGAEILSQSNLRERLQSADEAAVCPGLREPNPSQPSRYCQRIDMHRQHVQRSIKRLLELGIVLEGVRIGISRSYRLNPNFGWKGSAKGHREALAEHLKIVK